MVENNSGSNKNPKYSKKNHSEENFDWKRAGKTSFLWLMLIFGAVYISGLLTKALMTLLFSVLFSFIPPPKLNI